VGQIPLFHNYNKNNLLRAQPKQMDAWQAACTQPIVGFRLPRQIFRSVTGLSRINAFPQCQSRRAVM
jgi:hypothetical protein